MSYRTKHLLTLWAIFIAGAFFGKGVSCEWTVASYLVVPATLLMLGKILNDLTDEIEFCDEEEECEEETSEEEQVAQSKPEEPKKPE